MNTEAPDDNPPTAEEVTGPIHVFEVICLCDASGAMSNAKQREANAAQQKLHDQYGETHVIQRPMIVIDTGMAFAVLTAVRLDNYFKMADLDGMAAARTTAQGQRALAEIQQGGVAIATGAIPDGPPSAPSGMRGAFG